MFAGKRFKLKTSTIAIENVEGRPSAVTVPANAVVVVVAGPHNGDRLLDVLLEGRTVMMFTIDVRERGEEIVS